MESACGRWITVFNGEIYNYKALSKELRSSGHTFRGQSDTEVLLAAVSEWGLEGALARFVGMFAFALWDKLERKLSLVRDRVGEKPLYYGRLGAAFVFGSELGALRVHPAGVHAKRAREILNTLGRSNSSAHGMTDTSRE